MRKISIFVVLLFIINQFGLIINFSYAGGLDNYYSKASIDIGSFTNSQDDIGVNPLQEFRYESWVDNKSGGSIDGVNFFTIFPSGIEYNDDYGDGTPPGSKVAGIFLNGSYSKIIHPSNFNPNSIPNYNNSFTFNNNDRYQVRRILLTFPQDWSTYENTLSTRFESSDGSIISNTNSSNIYVNVKPHIVDYGFRDINGTTTTAIQGADTESIDLQVKVKDFNGCSNIANGSVTANLSQLGLGTQESLTYQSCESDGITAVFKKTGITTNVDTGTYSFNGRDHFVAIDVDGNLNNPDDSYFGINGSHSQNGKVSGISLEVVSAGTPQVSFLGLEYNIIGGNNRQSSTLSFSGDQSGEYMINIGSCSSDTPLIGWNAYTLGEQIDYSILSSDLFDGTNNIYACVRNVDGDIGSYNFNLIKDTEIPVIDPMSFSPSSVSSQDSEVSFACSKESQYKVCLSDGGNCLEAIIDYDNFISVGTNQKITIPNSILNIGTNDITVFCRDEATNIGTLTRQITKTQLPPSMENELNIFEDRDDDFEGVDGRDIYIEWNNQIGIDYENFSAWRIYLIPFNLDESELSKNSHIKSIPNKNISSWIGDETITSDSFGNNISEGGNYKLCIAIISTAGDLGNYGCLTSDLIADTIENPTVLSASFTSDTNLRIVTDSTLSTVLSDHDVNLINYTYDGNVYNGNSISSVSDKTINISIPSLGDTAATATDFTVFTGAIRAGIGGFNNEQIFGSIEDKQNPIISDFQITNIPNFENTYKWFSGDLNLTWNISESLKASGNTRVEFTRTSGNSSSNYNYNVTSSNLLTKGTHSTSFTPSLTCGTIYQARFRGTDLANNIGFSDNITNIGFDNCAPSIPILNTKDILGETSDTFSWQASIDDNGNGSGVKNYDIKIFNGHLCNETEFFSDTITDTSILINDFTTGNYSWKIRSRDNVGNTSNFSSCDDFVVDTEIPIIQNISIKDTVINSTSFTKSSNNVQVSANISNTNKVNVGANLTSLLGTGYDNVNCDNPDTGITCIKSGNTYTFEFEVTGGLTDGTKQTRFIAQNTNGLNEQIGNWMSITVDNTSPTTGNITNPDENENYGGDNLNISWTGISDNNMDYLEFLYSKDNGTYNTIGTGANASPYNWDISSLDSGSYIIKIIAKDKAGNTSETFSGEFNILKEGPQIVPGIITSPISGEFLKGNTSINLLWDTQKITHTVDFTIKLEYSSNNGLNWNLISKNLENTGSYTWSIPFINSSQVKLRIKAIDEIGNKSEYDIIDYTFVIDSDAPNFNFEVGTPPNGSHINDNGFDIIGNANDNIKLDSIYYSFKRNADSHYWDGTNYNGTLFWNLIDENIDGVSYNLSKTINPNIVHAGTYDLAFRIIDKSGNEKITTARQYFADTVDPVIEINNLNGSYFKDTINLNGAVSDDGSGVKSVFLQIKKGEEYFNGTDWQLEEYSINTILDGSIWSYDFTPPILDESGQEYNIKAVAEDKSYKDGLISEKNITLLLDKTAPIIQDNVFTFDSSKIYAGGDNINITWEQAKISDEHSGLKDNPVKLEFYNGTQWILVGDELENNGIFENYQLPEIDSSIARFRITVSDKVLNTKTQNSNTFRVDSTNPEIERVSTAGDGNGQIDRLIVEFNKEINMSSFDKNTFNIDNGITISTISNIDHSGEKTKFTLIFDESFGNTSSIPILYWDNGIIQDFAGNTLVGGNMQSENKANPVILNSKIFDNDNDGKFDLIKVEFSEDMNNLSFDNSIFTFSNKLLGLGISGITRDELNNSVLNISLSGQVDINTDPGNMLLNFLGNNDTFRDLSGNNASNKNNINLIDKAKPILLEGFVKDTNNDFEADKIEITFSENIVGDVVGFSLNEGNLSNGYIDSNKIIFDIGGIITTNPDLSISFTEGNILDESGNILENITNFNLQEKISPKLLSAKTLDQNGNGKIDSILLDFSEDVNGLFADFSLSVSSWNVLSYDMLGSSQVIVNIQEKSLIDTSSTPTINIDTNTTLKDLSDNLVKINQSLIVDDGIGPVINGARFNEGENKLYLTFSENISTNLVLSDFVLDNFLGNSITSVDFTIGTNTAVLTMNTSDIIYGSSQISFVGGQVEDSIGNSQSNTIYQIVLASIIINEVMIEGDISYIELKNISSSSVDISGWIIENALTGGDYTIPSSQIIAENGYYLIATTNDYFSGITANQIANLDISSNLVLKNGAITVDNFIYQLSDNNISLERLDKCSDGLNIDCWYQALVSELFTSDIYKGTPGSENIFDNTPPDLNINIDNNLLLPQGYFNIIYNYDDNIEIDTSSINFNLEKFNGITWDILSSGFSLDNITDLKANYILEGLEYGRYRINFEISDTAGNKSQIQRIFYIDSLDFTINTNDINLGILEPGFTKLADEYVTITIKTIGAGFIINHSHNEDGINSWNTDKGYGACIGNNCTNLENFKNKEIINQIGELQTSGELKTYTYTIRYGSLIDNIQPAGIYNIDNNYDILLNY